MMRRASTVDVERTIEAQVQATQASPEPTVTPPPDIEAEEYAVYSAMIRQNPIGYNLGSFLVIKEQTVSDPEMFERTLEETRRLPAKLVDSYRSRNAAFYALGPNLDLEQDYGLMPQEEFDRIFRRGGAIWPTWCNSFFFDDSFPEWKRVPVDVEDGGRSFWQIEYILLKDECIDFYVHGES